MTAVIDRFLDEAREWAKTRQTVTGAHIAQIQAALVNAEAALCSKRCSNVRA
jgi:hypothetical protein